MGLKPGWLMGVVGALGLLLLGGIFLLSHHLDLRYRLVILAVSIAAWYVLAVWLCIPAAVIAQAARNKRHGVFSHLKRSTTRELQEEESAAAQR